MTLYVDSLLCRQCYAYCDETADARIKRFSLLSSRARNGKRSAGGPFPFPIPSCPPLLPWLRGRAVLLADGISVANTVLSNCKRCGRAVKICQILRQCVIMSAHECLQFAITTAQVTHKKLGLKVYNTDIAGLVSNGTGQYTVT